MDYIIKEKYMQNIIKNIVDIFFENLGIENESIDIENIKSTDIYNIKIKTKNSWLIIWPQWKTLDSFHNLIQLISSKQIWKRIKINIEVNDYIKREDNKLLNLVKNKIELIEKTWNDIKLPYYSSYERKKIHSIVHKLNYKWVSTKSIWEWKERRLYICKEKTKLTIDIDWVDI